MGFKCPICFKDFAQDREAWKKHCDTAHAGTAKVIVDSVIEACEKVPENEKSGKGAEEEIDPMNAKKTLIQLSNDFQKRTGFPLMHLQEALEDNASLLESYIAYGRDIRNYYEGAQEAAQSASQLLKEAANRCADEIGGDSDDLPRIPGL